MSAGNRKNQYRLDDTQAVAHTNRRFVYILALVAAAGLLLGLILSSAPAKADVDYELGPVATVYTVKGVYGTKATGFYVRYHNGRINVLPPIKSRLADANDGAERFMIKNRYRALAELKHTLNDFHANQVF
jgi:hypothetical protein